MLVEPGIKHIGGEHRHKVAHRHVDAQFHKVLAQHSGLLCRELRRRIVLVPEQNGKKGTTGSIGNNRWQHTVFSQIIEKRH